MEILIAVVVGIIVAAILVKVAQYQVNKANMVRKEKLKEQQHKIEALQREIYDSGQQHMNEAIVKDIAETKATTSESVMNEIQKFHASGGVPLDEINYSYNFPPGWGSVTIHKEQEDWIKNSNTKYEDSNIIGDNKKAMLELIEKKKNRKPFYKDKNKKDWE